MDTILKTKEEPDVDEMVVFLNSLNEQEKKVVLGMIQGVQMGMIFAKEKLDSDKIA